ncbi:MULTISPECIES: hypothetical protein [unclassified Rhizobium]|uniref:hypothetical protein n=1 Tax=unclassified Rhizobium TaxID=2613769 RepID=UPI0006FF16A2|nr:MULTISPECIES: hypothetical protein [unclassified Rhizobium]KQV34706.1 hypothetical protein ASC86_14405 [Rhizobium sp. Root1212]KRD24040.1 hypothetical protein ASE37_14400 [Rhizobium sp. Root268]
MVDFSRIPQQLDSAIQARTAEMLALPGLVCTRKCRQRRRCLYISRETKAPWCLGLLTGNQQALYESLRDLARQWAVWLVPGAFVRHGTDAATLSPLAKAAVEIIAASLPRSDRLHPEARLWRRALYRCKTPKIGARSAAVEQTTEI